LLTGKRKGPRPTRGAPSLLGYRSPYHPCPGARREMNRMRRRRRLFVVALTRPSGLREDTRMSILPAQPGGFEGNVREAA
jgi:hypothetical protein